MELHIAHAASAVPRLFLFPLDTPPAMEAAVLGGGRLGEVLGAASATSSGDSVGSFVVSVCDGLSTPMPTRSPSWRLFVRQRGPAAPVHGRAIESMYSVMAASFFLLLGIAFGCSNGGRGHCLLKLTTTMAGA